MHSFLGEIYIRPIFLIIFVANKIGKSFFTKTDLIRYNYFINIYVFN